ncbi:MAG TPA: SMC family ATPase, partial [Methanomassiliicoccales archaeon]|nr:SMC family ATPase [Methanomassiliicoccales archaeon]
PEQGAGIIRLRSLELHNYRKFRHSMVDLGDGVIGILGQNGVGKSTLVEAIAWAIYGNESSIVRTGKEGVRSSDAGPNQDCIVVVEFDLETDHYRLMRSLKGKDSKVDAALMVNERLVAKGDRTVTDTMVKRLGMDHKAFFISVFARQKELNALSNLRPAERKKLVLRMLGVDVLDSVVDLISQDARAIGSALSGLSSSVRDADGNDRRERINSERMALNGKKDDLTLTITTLRTKLSMSVALVNAAAHSMEMADSRSARYNDLCTRQVRLDADLRNLAQRRKRLDDEAAALEGKRRELPELERAGQDYLRLESEKESLDESRVKFATMASLKELMARKGTEIEQIQKDLASAQLDLSKHVDVDEKLGTYEEALTSYDEVIARDREDLAWCAQETVRLNKEMSLKRARREDVLRLGPESVCPTCDRRMGEQHDHLLQRLDEELDAIVKGIADLESRRNRSEEGMRRNRERRLNIEARRTDALKSRDAANTLRAMIESFERSKERAEEERTKAARQVDNLGTVVYDAIRHDEIKSRLAQLRPQVERMRVLRAELQRSAAIEAERKENSIRTDAEQKELAEVHSNLTDLKFDPQEPRTAKAAYAAARDEKDRIQGQLARSETELAGTISTLGSMEERLQELDAVALKIEEMRGQQMELNVLVSVMREFRGNIMSRILPTLSRSASELFIQLTEGKYGGMELNEDYEMLIFDGGEKYPLDRFSGGESDLANLCLRLAISRLIADRSGQRVNFLVLDEIFGSQDAVRKRNILEMLSSLQRQFGQILLITHIDDVKDAVGELITVKELEDGSSVLEAR